MLVVKHKNKIFEDYYNSNDVDGNYDDKEYAVDIAKKTQSEDAPYRRPDGKLVDMETIVWCFNSLVLDIKKNFDDLGKLLSRMDIYFTNEINTMATDGVSIFINPVWVDVKILDRFGRNDEDDFLSMKAMEFVIIHELFHMIFDHVKQYERLSETYSDFFKVNCAQDYEINYFIENYVMCGTERRFKKMVKKIGGLINDEYGKQGLLWEDIYNRLDVKGKKSKACKTSSDWKRGFSEGFNEIIKELKNKKLIEHYEI